MPPWFAEAAKRAFQQNSPESEGITVAEMTLINTAPVTQIAASPVSADSPSRAVPQTASAAPEVVGMSKQEVEDIARECYKKVRELMEIMRMRNGGDIYG